MGAERIIEKPSLLVGKDRCRSASSRLKGNTLKQKGEEEIPVRGGQDPITT